MMAEAFVRQPLRIRPQAVFFFATARERCIIFIAYM